MFLSIDIVVPSVGRVASDASGSLSANTRLLTVRSPTLTYSNLQFEATNVHRNLTGCVSATLAEGQENRVEMS